MPHDTLPDLLYRLALAIGRLAAEHSNWLIGALAVSWLALGLSLKPRVYRTADRLEQALKQRDDLVKQLGAAPGKDTSVLKIARWPTDPTDPPSK